MVDKASQLPARFSLPDGTGSGEIASCLGELGKVNSTPWSEGEHLLLDSFDWRLYDAGFVLEQVTQRDDCRIVLRNRRTGEDCGSLPLAAPKFANELPDHPLRQRLGSLLRVRALLPLVRIHNRTCEISLLDANDKTVVHARIEQLHAGKASAKSRLQRLENRLCIIPVKGFPEAFARARAHLIDTLCLEEEKPTVHDTAFAAAGCEPLSYSSKLDIQLIAGMPATVAVAKILRTLLETMQTNENGIENDVDSEFLHDFRVAVRRSRSILTQLDEALPEKDVEQFRTELNWLGGITGPLRDLDVYLLQFDDYRNMLDAGMGDQLAPLRTFLIQKREAEMQKLKKSLHSARYRKLKRNWHNLIEARLTGPVAPEEYDRPILALANRRIAKLFRRALREGRMIDSDSPNEELHELRKTGKKLRYLLEFFASLYSEKMLAKQVRSLKKLQDNLGEFQDLAVQGQWLQAIRHEMLAAGTLSEPTGQAVDMLVMQLHKRQHKARKKFADRFEKFADKQNGRDMQRMLKGKGT